MSSVGLILLLIIHAFHVFQRFLSSIIPLRTPKPLLARRRRIPAHLAVLLVPDAENYNAREEEIVMEECVEQVVDWCKELGVQRLSIYERDGVLSRKSRYTSHALSQETLDLSDDTTFEPPRAPLTPPPSDSDPTSRPRSPDLEDAPRNLSVTTLKIPYLTSDDGLNREKKAHRRRRQSQIFESKPRHQSLTLHILSRESSKPAIAAVGRALALAHETRTSSSFSLTIDSLNDLLEGENGFPSLDLIIVHHLHPSTNPLELYGFPPWQSGQSEIFHTPRRPRVPRQWIRRRDPIPTAMALSEVDFRRALDEYSGAEVRLGK